MQVASLAQCYEPIALTQEQGEKMIQMSKHQEDQDPMSILMKEMKKRPVGRPRKEKTEKPEKRKKYKLTVNNKVHECYTVKEASKIAKIGANCMHRLLTGSTTLRTKPALAKLGHIKIEKIQRETVNEIVNEKNQLDEYMKECEDATDINRAFEEALENYIKMTVKKAFAQNT